MRQIVKLLGRELIANALLLANLEHGASRLQSEPAHLGFAQSALLQQVTLVHHKCIEHPKGLLGRQNVSLQAQQPARHALEALESASRLLRQFVLLAPLLVQVAAILAALLHQQLLDNFTRHHVFYLNLILVRQIVGNVPEGDYRRSVVVGARRQCVLDSLDYLREYRVVNVGHVDEEASDGLFGLLGRAGLGEVLANWHEVIGHLRRHVAQRLILAEEGEYREYQRAHHLVVELQQLHQLHENVVVQKVRAKDKRQHDEQSQALLAGVVWIQADLLDDIATLEAVLHVAD